MDRPGASKRADAGRIQNGIAAFLLTAVLFVPIVLCYDFYYDLNDDALIRDILSGAYSGRPDAHAVQLLYPLGLFLSLLYRWLPSAPVFGVFLLLCQFGSLFLIGWRTASCFDCWKEKAPALAAVFAFFAAALLRHLVFVQYTVTAGMMAGAAIFWFLTDRGQEGEGAFAFLRRSLPAFFLYWLAFCLRSEMALLLLPLAGAAGLCRWGEEKKILSWENLKKYGISLGALLLGLLLCFGWDSLAYRNGGWSEFRRLFQARTELYDYRMDFINDYNANEAAYQALGVSPKRHALLKTYNFGADDRMDAGFFEALKEAADAREGAGGLFRKSGREALWELCFRHWFSAADLAYSLPFLLLGAALTAQGIWKRRFFLLWQTALTVAVGAFLWLFLLLRDRPVDRVFHPLYLAQILLFAGLLFRQPERTDGTGRLCRNLAAVLLLGCGLVFLPAKIRDTTLEYERRETVNPVNEAVMTYCRAHPERLFLEDVYSTVAYSEKIMQETQTPFNYDLLGGWLIKSPLTAQKLSAFGYASMGEAVRSETGVCLLAEGNDGMQWLADYLEEEKTGLLVRPAGHIAQDVTIYQVESGK